MENQKTRDCEWNEAMIPRNKDYTNKIINTMNTLIFLDSGLLEEKQNINHLPREKKEQLSRYKSYLMFLPWYEKIENKIFFLTEEDYNACQQSYQQMSNHIFLFLTIAMMHQTGILKDAWPSNLPEKIEQLEKEIESYLVYARPTSPDTDSKLSSKPFWILTKSFMEYKSYEEYLKELTLCFMDPPIALKLNKGCE